MRQKPGTTKWLAESMVKDIRRRTRKQRSSEGKICIVLEGLRGEDSIAELCRREGIATSWSAPLELDRFPSLNWPARAHGGEGWCRDDTAAIAWS